ncbi:MAG: hypothetical protein IPL61_10510 [Myxococcales bacterium]|nr:hypothetical protein [Myxococcales bacterium]
MRALALLVALAAGVPACSSGDRGPSSAPSTASTARPRPRPAELAHLTLKVLGVT